MRALPLCAVASALFVLSAGASAAPLLITNGDFQTGSASGWSALNGAAVVADAGPSGVGDYALRVQTGDWQTTTTANNGAWMGVGGTTYTVSFDVKSGDTTASKQTDVFMQDAWGGNYPAHLAVQNSVTLSDGLWHHVSWSFTVTGGQFNLGLYAEGGGGARDIYFDNFSVAVPEPASLGLLAAAGLLLARRIRA